MTATSMHSPLRIALIIASRRKPRMADPLAAWLGAELAGLDWMQLDVIDLARVELPGADLGHAGSTVSPIAARLELADGFLVLTPEYNHSFPASLKDAIDWHLREWAYKPVGFVAYGAGSGGARAVEHLRVVFPELRAMTTREAVLLTAPWDHLDATGRYTPDEGVRAALAGTLDELRWWAGVLRMGRAGDRVGAA